MKKSTYIIIIAICFSIVPITKLDAQTFKGLDAIPHDISYCRETRATTPLAKVIYGRPSISDNEQAFGDIVPYGKLWRTGANEATEIKFYKDVVFGNTFVEAGTYVLITIPGKKEWEIILNKNTDVLGVFQYDPKANIASIKVPVRKAERLETFSISFKKDDYNVIMVLGWDNTRIKIPIAFKEHTYYAKL